jgi:hypothetical protein
MDSTTLGNNTGDRDTMATDLLPFFTRLYISEQNKKTRKDIHQLLVPGMFVML